MIVAVPPDTAVTNPVVGLTVATAGLLLLHVPPASPLELNVVDVDTHIGEVPVTVPAFTFGLTVKVWNEEAGPATVYVILVVPALNAVTKPEVGFTDATAGLVLLHVPPASPVDV